MPALFLSVLIVIYCLQTDVSKVIRYCRKLPDKEASLVKVYSSIQWNTNY